MGVLTVERKILQKNDVIAAENRAMFLQLGLFTINLLSSPGSGKTSLVEKTIEVLKEKVNMAVIEGDVQTDLDARRIEKLGVPVIQIVTNGGCHLEANLVHESFKNLIADHLQFLIIENVGNLVCPASYDLGEDCKVVLVSTTEGDDKPLKYPAMFIKAKVMIINKIDLVPYVNCKPDVIEQNALSINPDLKIFRTSCTTGEGIQEWCGWINSNLRVR
ncbi:MAG: hydrogenase nickel incorporation protein HypB [Bacteroidetes bacterium]|nr:hydrogenase nickel incorporation protein HypB [Bacteroidota bacterium]MBU2507962.1 hydrogenase nickel incorporation protein HypB [Bacteroidota bacterium]